MELIRDGGCLCGAVRYHMQGDWAGIINCHCKDCQRLHGNYNPMVAGLPEHLTFTRNDSLTWYRSSDAAERGFCSLCGSALFKRFTTEPKILVSVGSIDDTSGLQTFKNIWLQSKGDYYVVPEEHN